MVALFPHGYALLIGVGATAYTPWSLPVTVKDAQAIHAILADPQLCAYADEHIRLLHDQGATHDAILDGLAWLKDQVAADPQATVVVYYSGHGWLDTASGRYYLVQHDATPYDLPGSALAAQEFSAALHQVHAQRLLVVLDCCHAEGMATAKGKQLPPGFAKTAFPENLMGVLKQGTGRAVFTSSRDTQLSWMRPDGTMSLYTYHLIEALQGAGNKPGDTVVHLSHLMGHLGAAVPASAHALGREQTPFLDAATEDFAVALLRGGKGLPPGGWEDIQHEAAETIRRVVHAIGAGSVAISGDVSNSTIITGSGNIVQQGKYNVHINQASGLAIGDGAQVINPSNPEERGSS